MTRLRAGGATDVGLHRKNNEDNLLLAATVFAVADGMGGAASGEVASQLAVDALREALGDGDESSARTLPGPNEVAEAVRRANAAVFERGRLTEHRGMGTTITAVALVEDEGEERLAIANVGDSRAYRLTQGRLERLTDDHNVAEELVRRGEITAEQATQHPGRHQLTRVLGVQADVEVDVWEVLPHAGDRLLLCSDGLVNEVEDDAIAGVLRGTADPDAAARELVRLAKEGGGHDNITVVVVDVVDDDDAALTASAALAADPEEQEREAEIRAGRIAAGARSTMALDGDEPGSAGAAHAAAVDRWADDDRWADEPARVDAPRRRVTFRGAFLTFGILAVLGSAVALFVWAAVSPWQVRLEGDELIVVKGRTLGPFKERVLDEGSRTIDTEALDPIFVEDVREGVSCDTKEDALEYVELVAEFVAQAGDVLVGQGAGDGCSGLLPILDPSATTTSTAPPSTSTTAPPPAPAATTPGAGASSPAPGGTP